MRRNIVITALIATTLALAGAAARAASITATVAAIDSATRAITLKSAQGKVLVVTATPEVKNLAEVKVGDYLEVEYVEASALGLKKTGESVTATRNGQAAERSTGTQAGQVTVVAVVIGVDEATQTVTLRAPQRTLDLKVSDPEQFKLAAKGSQLEVTYVEATALAVKRAPTRK